jgi:hypothetical protein
MLRTTPRASAAQTNVPVRWLMKKTAIFAQDYSTAGVTGAMKACTITMLLKRQLRKQRKLAVSITRMTMTTAGVHTGHTGGTIITARITTMKIADKITTGGKDHIFPAFVYPLKSAGGNIFVYT